MKKRRPATPHRRGRCELSPTVCQDPSTDFQICPCVCISGMFTPDVCVGGANAFCYLPFSLKERVCILASFVGSNDCLSKHFTHFFFPFDFDCIDMFEILHQKDLHLCSGMWFTWRLIFVNWVITRCDFESSRHPLCNGSIALQVCNCPAYSPQRATKFFKASQFATIY